MQDSGPQGPGLEIPGLNHACYISFFLKDPWTRAVAAVNHLCSTERSFLTPAHSDTQVAPHIPLCPPSSSDVLLPSISLPSQIIFQSNVKPLEHQSVKIQAYFFFLKTGQGGRHWLKLACTGTCWSTLAREWYRLNGCQVIEDCQRNFK